MKLRRALAGLLLASLLLAAFVPSALAHDHDHLHCSDADCSTCLAIRTGAALLRMLALAFLGFALLRMPAIPAIFHILRAARAFAHITPVSLKVKMTN